MTPDLYERVALCRDLNEHFLKKGDLPCSSRVPHPSGGELGVVLSLYALGESISTVAVKEWKSRRCGPMRF